MADPFLRMLFCPEHKVLGKNLEPLSAYHLSVLALFKSPFWTGGHPTPTEIITAATICTTRWQNGMRSLMDLDMNKVEEWGAGIKVLDWDEATRDLRDYFEWYLDELPEPWQEKDEKSRMSAIPWPVHTVCTVLMYFAGITEAEAWNMPVNRLVAYKMAAAENNGCQLVTERQREIFRAIEAENREAARVAAEAEAKKAEADKTEGTTNG